MNPHIEWLRRKWRLPDIALPEVERLLAAESEGSTACEINDVPWGAAASTGSDDTPLAVVPSEGRWHLQSRRLFRAESAIASRILNLAATEFSPPSPATLERLFPGTSTADRQKAAAGVAASRALTLVTGGPGTGKTYTLARILTLLREAGLDPEAIRLAAPTGKAADRMKRAVADAAPSGSIPAAAPSSTLHALLGYNPETGRCRFTSRQPLSCAALIIDECSMVDVLLWQAVLDALPPGARLILVGDPNQLESVGQGNVFAALVRLAESPGSPLARCHVHLTEARRFRERPALLGLVRAMENSDADAAAAVLESPGAGVTWTPFHGGILPREKFPQSVLLALAAVATADSPKTALAALTRVCVLTAQRRYFVGAEAVSHAIDAHFAARPGLRNRPIIIDRNDPETGLRNGSVGVVHAAPDGSRQAVFQSAAGGLDTFPLSRLPAHSPAWALTIHRSQGSEYDEVLVLLPQESSPLATRELLYTAITRARDTVHVAGSLESVRKAVQTPSARRTLLGFHFAEAGLFHRR